VEEVGAVMAVGPAGRPGSQPAGPSGPRSKKDTRLGQVLPKLHAALVHFPIAWLVLLLLVDLRTFGLGRPGWERLGLYLLVATVLSLGVAAATGLARAGQITGAPDQAALVRAHRNLALVATGVAVAALALRLGLRNRLGPRIRWAYLALVAAATAAVLLAGHRGARVTFGQDFLPF